jgi:hypothetical protein
MLKPLHLMTPAEKAALAAELKKEAEQEGDLPVFIGNPNSLFLARPARRRKPASRTRTKVTA